MKLNEMTRDFILKPTKRSSILVLAVGVVLYLVGSLLLANRYVAICGWLVGVLGAINYARWFGRPDTESRSYQPWDNK